MKKIILAAILFLPFLVSCSQNRKAPAVSPQTTVGKSEKNETAKVQYLTTSDFRKKIMDYEAHPDEWVFAGSRPAVIDFYTTWCGPCKMMAPVVESLAGKYAGKIDFYKVDIDQESELASVFGISIRRSVQSPRRNGRTSGLYRSFILYAHVRGTRLYWAVPYRWGGGRGGFSVRDR